MLGARHAPERRGRGHETDSCVARGSCRGAVHKQRRAPACSTLCAHSWAAGRRACRGRVGAGVCCGHAGVRRPGNVHVQRDRYGTACNCCARKRAESGGDSAAGKVFVRARGAAASRRQALQASGADSWGRAACGAGVGQTDGDRLGAWWLADAQLAGIGVHCQNHLVPRSQRKPGVQQAPANGLSLQPPACLVHAPDMPPRVGCAEGRM